MKNIDLNILLIYINEVYKVNATWCNISNRNFLLKINNEYLNIEHDKLRYEDPLLLINKKDYQRWLNLKVLLN